MEFRSAQFGTENAVYKSKLKEGDIMGHREKKKGRTSIWSKRFKRHMMNRLVWHRWHEVAYEDAVKLIKGMRWG